MAKTAAQKKAEADKKKLIYRTVVNLTGDSKLASLYRGRPAQVEKDLGITLPDTIPPLKPRPKKVMTEEQKKKRREADAKRKKIAYRTVLNETGNVELANFYRSRPRRLEQDLQIKLPKRVPTLKKQKTRKKASDPLFAKYMRPTLKKRKEQWKTWSENKPKLMPKEIQKKAIRINREKGIKDDKAAYGYAVLYYAYVRNELVDLWLKRLIPDMDLEGELYLNVSGFKA